MNWSKIIRELMAAGKRQVEIAERLGVSQSTISQVLRSDGKRDIPFAQASLLLALHIEVCGTPAEEQPHA